MLSFQAASIRIFDQFNYNIFSMTPEGYYPNPGKIQILRSPTLNSQ